MPKKILMVVLGFSVALQASESATRNKNIVLSKSEKLIQELLKLCDQPFADLPSKIIAHNVLYKHPVIDFILQGIKWKNLILSGHAAYVGHASFNQTSDRVITASHDNTAKIWDATNGQCLLTLVHTNWVHRGFFSPWGNRVITQAAARTLEERDDMSIRVTHVDCKNIWNSITGERLATFELLPIVGEVSFKTILDQTMLTSIDRRERVSDIKDNQCSGLFEVPAEHFSITFNEKVDKVAVGSGNTLKIYDATTGRRLVSSSWDGYRVLCISFNVQGDKIMLLTTHRAFEIWDAVTGHILFEPVHDKSVSTHSFNEQGDKLATGSDDGTVKIWDVGSGDCLKTFTLNNTGVYSVKFNKAGNKILTMFHKLTPLYNSDGTHGGDNIDSTVIQMWDVDTGFCIITLPEFEGHISSVVLSDAGDSVIICEDNSAQIWDLRPKLRVYDYLTGGHTVTIEQAIILCALYEIIVCRRLVSKIGANAFRVQNETVDAENIQLDFTQFRHLQKYYDDLGVRRGYNTVEGNPVKVIDLGIKEILSPYVLLNEVTYASSSSDLTP